MQVLWFYLLFALTTSFTAHYELIFPVLDILEISEPTNNVIVYKKTFIFCTFLVALLLAPLIIFPSLVPSIGEHFRNGFLKGLSEAKKI